MQVVWEESSMQLVLRNRTCGSRIILFRHLQWRIQCFFVERHRELLGGDENFSMGRQTD